MPVVVMNSLSQAPLVDDLGVAGDDLDAGLLGRRSPSSRRFCRNRSMVDAFLDDHGAGKIERRRTADREIVDRAADRELADIAAGKDQRIDDKGVGGEGQPIALRAPARQIETRLVLQQRQQRHCRKP